MSRRLDWDVEGAHWPHRDASRFVAAGGLRWHVQVLGDLESARPVALLLHVPCQRHVVLREAPMLLPESL
jgi:magnesium chelatase accessory protein